MSGVYDGLTVVELADRRNQWAGKLLADGGARVIQIEPPAGGPGRWCGPFVDDDLSVTHCRCVRVTGHDDLLQAARRLVVW